MTMTSSSAAPKAAKPTIVSKTAAADAILNTSGKFFTVIVAKKNPSKKKGAPLYIENKMTGRLEVVRHSKAGKAAIEAGKPLPKSDATKDPLLRLGKVRMYEMTGDDKGYKTIDLNRVLGYVASNETFKVRGAKLPTE